jgi:hypothetical protein
MSQIARLLTRHSMPSALLLAGFLTASAASAADRQEAKVARHIEHTITALKALTDADSLAAAGVLSIGDNSDRSLGFIARASSAAPDRADLVWLQAVRCSQLPPCNPEPLELRLRELDPANGTGWFGALTRASVAKNDADIDVALEKIGQSDRADIYWTALIAHLSRAAERTGKISLEDAEVSIVGNLASDAIPAYQYISKACKGERLQQPKILDDCRGVAKSLQRGDNLVTEMVGVAIAKRVWPEDSPEWKAAVEARRVFEYRAKFITKMDPRGEKHAKEYLELCAQHHRAQDVFVAEMIAAGVNPNPPSSSGRAVPTSM